MCWSVGGDVGNCWVRCGEVCAGGVGKCVGVWESVLGCGGRCGKVLGKVWGKYKGGVGKCVGVWRR